MIIDKISLQNFRKFKDQEINLKPGINVILGPNETGKSTISEAILNLLFIDPATKSKQHLERIAPWSGANGTLLEMEFHNADSRFRLRKDFYNGATLLHNLNTDKKTDSFKAVQIAISKLIGMDTREVFESTAFIKQSDIAAINESNDLVTSIYRVLLSSQTKVDVNEVIAKLQNTLKKWRVGMDRPAKNPGIIKTLTAEIQNLENQLEDAGATWEKATNAIETLQESKDGLVKIKQKIEQLEKLINNNRIFRESQTKLANIDTQLAYLEKRLLAVAELEKEIANTSVNLKTYSRFDNSQLEEDSRKITKYVEVNSMSEGELKKLAEQEKQAAEDKFVVKEQNNTARLVAVACFFAVIGTGFAVLKSNFSFAFLGIVLGIIVVYVAYYINKKMQSNTAKTRRISEMDFMKQRLENAILSNKDELEKLFQKYNVTNVEQFFKEKTDYLAVVDKLKSLKAHLQGTLQDKSITELKEEQVVLFKQKKEIEINFLTEEVKASQISPEEYLRKSNELEQLMRQKNSLEEAYTASKVRAEDSQISKDDITAMEERLENKKAELKFCLEEEQVIKLTLMHLEKSIAGVASMAEKSVGEELEKYLPKLTNDRYKNARLTKKLQVEIFSDEKNDWIDPVKHLSKGAVDQIYFLTRLAFVAVLLGEKTLPLILDDPFVTFDEERRGLARKILNEFAQKYQIILFTHDKSYISWGNPIDFYPVVQNK